MKKEEIKQAAIYCYICGKEILPCDGEPVYIRTKRNSELFIHMRCMNGR